MPPLRERPDDIPALVQALLERINEKVHQRVNRVPPEVLEHLRALPWRGNIRELENVLTRAVVLAPADVLLAEHLPPLAPTAAPAPATGWPPEGPLPSLAEAERLLISRALTLTHGHKGKACQMLGISRPTLERKLAKYRLLETFPRRLKTVS